MQTPDTLDTLRQQFQALKDDATRRCKITPTMISRATESHISKIQSIKLRQMVCAIIGLILWPYLCYSMGLSVGFEVATIIMLLGSAIYEWWNLKDLSDPVTDSQNLMQLAHRCLRTKRRMLIQLYIGSGVVFLWFIYFCCEITRIMPAEQARLTIILSAVGAVVGFFIGLGYWRRIRRELSVMYTNVNDILSTENS